MIDEKILSAAKESILEGEIDTAEEIANNGLADGLDPGELIEKGFVPGIMEVGELFEDGEIFLPEVMMAADAMKAAVKILSAAIEEQGGAKEAKAKIVLATVKADVHDIGKGIVASLMVANGFEVFDLGRDVPSEKIVNTAIENDCQFIGSSALLTTTMVNQGEIEKLLAEKGMKGKIKTIVGGAPVTIRWQEKIGADGFGETAAESVRLVNQWMKE